MFKVDFTGNSDQQTTVRSIFAESVLANSIRIYPLEWNVGIGMRFDVTGCDATGIKIWKIIKFQK